MIQLYSNTGFVSRLQVTGSDTFAINTGYTERLRIDSSGRVGIGTTSPGKLLTVSSASGGTLVNITNTTNADFQVTCTSGVATIGPTVGQVAFRSNNTERMRIDSSGNVGIGTTLIGGYRLHVVSSGATTAQFRRNTNTGGLIDFNYAGSAVGSISTNGTTTAYNTSSDYRLKENVVNVTDGITRLQQLKPSRFNFIADPDATVDGFIAHEVQTVVPEAVTGAHNEVDDDGNPVYQGIDQSKLVPLLTAALQEAIAKIETLESKVAALEAAS